MPGRASQKTGSTPCHIAITNSPTYSDLSSEADFHRARSAHPTSFASVNDLVQLVISHVGPDPPRACARKRWIQNRCVVRLQGLGLENAFFHPIEKRTDKLPAPSHPITPGFAGYGHSLALVDSFLTVQWKMIAIFAGCHMCQQPRSRQPPLDWLHRFLRR